MSRRDVISLDAVLGSFIPSRLQMSLSGKAEEYARTSEGSASVDAEATFFHESVHLYQTLMTGYGHLAWQSHRQATGYSVTEWMQLTQDTPHARRLPLAYLARKGPTQFVKSLIDEKTFRDNLVTMMARHSLPTPSATLRELDLSLLQHDWKANPELSLFGKQFFLQGRDILEGQAHHHEGIYALAMHGVPIEGFEETMRRQEKYWLAKMWFLSQVGPERTLDFPLICDLALLIEWRLHLQTENEWRDTHPAWRFVTLTNALRTAGDNFRFDRKGDLANSYKAYADNLLHACGYKSVDEVLSNWMKFYTRRPALTEFERMMRDGLEFRQKHPWCAADPLCDPSVFGAMQRSFRPPFIEIEGRIHSLRESQESPGPSITLMTETVAELQFQALAAQINGRFNASAVRRNEIQCAFAYFDIPRGCLHQEVDYCSGSFHPSKDSPFPLIVNEQNEATGCSFAALMRSLRLATTDLDLHHGYELPELKKAEEEMRTLFGLQKSQPAE